MGRKRKKEKIKLSRKTKKKAGRGKESTVPEKPFVTAEEYTDTNRDEGPVDEAAPDDIQEDPAEDTPDRTDAVVAEKEKSSEAEITEKIGQARNLSPYLVSGLVFLFFTAVAFVLYFPAIEGEFVFDDKPNILESTAIRLTDFSFAGLKKAALEGRLSARPVANITFALNYLGHGYTVEGYHIINIIIHAINGFLLFLFFRLTLNLMRPTGQNPASIAVPFIAALIWLVHPMQSQSVAYVVQRMNSMAAMFYILAIVCYARARLAETKKSQYLLFACSAFSGLLAVGTKEISATLPVFIFLYEWYFFQDLDHKWIKKKMGYIFGVLILSLVFAFLFLGDNPIDRIFAGYQVRDFTPEQRVLTQFRVVILYVSKLLFPHPSRLSLEHDFSLSYSFFDPPTTIVSMGTLLSILLMAIFWAGKHRLASFAILWFLGNLFIESSFISLEMVFEHRVYLPSMFLILTATVLAAKLIKMPKLKIVISCLVIVILSFWTFERSRVWGDEELLGRDNVAKSPNKFRMYTNLANLLMKKGKLEEALENYNTALRLNPDDEKAYLGIGSIFNYQGRYDEAIQYFNTSLVKNGGAYKTVTSQAYLGLGYAYAKRWNLEQAIHYYRVALQVDPTSAKARSQLQKAEKMLQAQKLKESK